MFLKNIDSNEEDSIQYMKYSIWDFNKRDDLGILKRPIKGSSPIGIPLQCILRFSKEGDWILDPFCGSGSTLLACSYLKRKGIAIEINPKIASIAKENLENGKNIPSISGWINYQKIIKADSLFFMCECLKPNSIDMVFAHPPYWNLIKYSDQYSYIKNDLSNEKTLTDFLLKIEVMFQGIKRVLKADHFLCILIGDVFTYNGKSIPLDYYLTKIALENNFEFHSKIIKVTHNAVSRKNKIEYWENRSIKENIFICIHDYLIIFQNRKEG